MSKNFVIDSVWTCGCILIRTTRLILGLGCKTLKPIPCRGISPDQFYQLIPNMEPNDTVDECGKENEISF